MNIGEFLLWSFAATLILTSVMSAAKALGLSRMDLPFILGTLFTSNRNKAPLYGFGTHLIMGWFFSLLYVAAFDSAQLYTWWFGMGIGFIHSSFILTSGLQIVAVFHPRMAQPHQGPTPTRQLEPPGFLALNYGNGTPIATVCAHLLYGAVLGTFYH